jgi:hypothetical protein
MIMAAAAPADISTRANDVLITRLLPRPARLVAAP